MKTRLPDGALALNRIGVQRPEGYSGAPRRIFNRATGRGFEVKAAADEAVITLYDEIGYWGVTAKDFRAQLERVDRKKINLRINSPGGDVFDGIAIYNDLVDHPAEVRVTITGVAASAASLIAMAGDRIEIAENAFIMIHNAWGVCVGSKAEMKAFFEVLGEIDQALAETYAARTGHAQAEVEKMMAAETWLRGAAAVAGKFADATVEGEGEGEGGAAAARFDLSLFRNAPQTAGLRPKERSAPKTPRDLEAILRDAELSREEAKAAIALAAAEDLRSQRDACDSDILAGIHRLIETLKG